MMAVDRDRRSVATNKLGGYISVSLCVLSIYAFQIVASKDNSMSRYHFDLINIPNLLPDLDVDQPPISVIAFLGERASFKVPLNCVGVRWGI